MYVQIDLGASAEAALLEPDDFRSFKVVVRGGPADDPALANAIAPHGRLEGDHAFLRIDAVEALAGDRSDDPAWKEGFAAMVDYARGHGWVDDAGTAIRAHIEAA
jgi:hypothetical protein